jgi:hypothetical protein
MDRVIFMAASTNLAIASWTIIKECYMHFVQDLGHRLELTTKYLHIHCQGPLNAREHAALTHLGFEQKPGRWSYAWQSWAEFDELMDEVESALLGLVWELRGDEQEVYNGAMIARAIGYTGDFALLIPGFQRHEYPAAYVVEEDIYAIMSLKKGETMHSFPLPATE